MGGQGKSIILYTLTKAVGREGELSLGVDNRSTPHPLYKSPNFR